MIETESDIQVLSPDTQGFGSPLPRRYPHSPTDQFAHQELERRNLGEQLRNCNLWIDKYWHSFYDKQREMGWAAFSGRSETLVSV